MSDSPERPDVVSPRSRRGPDARQIFGIIVVILVLVFAFENIHQVKVRLLIPEVKVSLLVALLVAAALGSLGTLLLQFRKRRRKQPPVR